MVGDEIWGSKDSSGLLKSISYGKERLLRSLRS